MARGWVAGQPAKIVQRWNDVAGHLGIRLGISSEETVVRRDATAGTLRIENPVNHRSQRVRRRNSCGRVRIEVPMFECCPQFVRSELRKQRDNTLRRAQQTRGFAQHANGFGGHEVSVGTALGTVHLGVRTFAYVRLRSCACARSKRPFKRSSIAVRQFVVARTSALHRREKAASRFPASAVARFAWTSLPRPGGARQCSAALLPAETVHACEPGSPKGDRPPWAANRAPASSPRAPQSLPSAAAAPLRAAYYAWLRERCASSPDAISLSALTLASHSRPRIRPGHDLKTAPAPQPTTPCSFCRCKSGSVWA